MFTSKLLQQLVSLNSSGGNPKDQTDRYRVVLESIVNRKDPKETIEGLKLFIEGIINESVSLVISRQLLTEIANILPKFSDNVVIQVSHYILDRIQPRVISFEEQVTSIRQHLASIYEANDQWKEAANVLVCVNLFITFY